MPLPDRLTATTVAALDDATVDRVHAELLAPVFRPEELLSRADLGSTYGPGAPSPSTVLLQAGRPEAVMLGEWFQRRRAVLLSYLSVSELARGTGLGTTLLTELLPTWWADTEPPSVLAEVDDPSVWPADTMGGDPEARLRFYGRHGATLAPLAYTQPSLGGGRGAGMLLLRLREGSPPPVALADVLREYYGRAEGAAAVAEPEVARLLDLAARCDADGQWWDVSRWPQVRQRR